MKATHIVIHSHDYGATSYMIHYKGKDKNGPCEEEIITALSLDFEDDKGESIDIFPLDDNEIVVIE